VQFVVIQFILAFFVQCRDLNCPLTPSPPPPPPPPVHPCAELPKAHLVSNWAANKKLKVGFMTSDFRKHPMAYLFINMFRLGVLFLFCYGFCVLLLGIQFPTTNCRFSDGVSCFDVFGFRMLDHNKLHVVCIMTFHNDHSPYVAPQIITDICI
jgi:hypothetical protein